MSEEQKHPMQPIELDDHGVARFKENGIVRWMLEMGRDGKTFDLHSIAVHKFDENDFTQFRQLIGDSVSLFCDLSNVSEKAKDEACDIADKLQ